MDGRKGSRIRALVALAAVIVVLEVLPAEAHPSSAAQVAQSSHVQTVAP
jgi:hypothetical protein